MTNNINKLIIATLAASVTLSSCADFEDSDFQVAKPDTVAVIEQLSAYGTLLDYVSPSFKIGNTLDMPTFTQQGTATTLTVHNFNEITLSGVFSHAKLVNEEGVANAKVEDFDNAVRFAKEHNIFVYGHSIVNSDVNSAYLGGKIVAEKQDIDVPMATAETIDLLGGENFAEGMVPKGWRCDQDGEIHEYPNTYSSGARTFEGFGGYQGKGLYWRVKTAEYGAQPDNLLSLTAGQYKLTFAVAAWKVKPSYMVEILDASGNAIASSDVFAAIPDAEGNKTADLSSAELHEMPFSVDNDGNYTVRFTNKTDGFSEFLLLACNLEVLKPVDDYEYTDCLGGENFAEGMVPKGWRCDQDGEIHEYPNTYSSGARTFEGFGGYQGKGVYWRVKTAEYGALTDNQLELTPAQHKLVFAVAAWKGNPNYMVEVLDASGNAIASSDVYAAIPDAEGNKSADLSSAEEHELSFTVDVAGNYTIRFTNKTDGFSEFLLLECKLGALKSAAPMEPTYSDATKQTAESELKKYVSAVVSENPDVTAWTVVENPVSSNTIIWNKVLGSSYVGSAAKYARAANSSAKLFVSETGLEDAEIRAALIDIVKASSDIDGINVAVAINENTDLSTVLPDLSATGKTIRLNILSVADAASLSKALAAYKQIPDAQRYGITFANVSGIWEGENFNRTEAYKILVDSLK